METKKIALALLVLLVLGSCARKESAQNTILCGTTMIESMVLDLAPEANTIVLVPPGQCPGSFDMKPDDARQAASAGIFMLHPFQEYLTEKIRKINKNVKIGVIKAKDLNVPANYGAGLLEMEGALLKYFPGREAEFSNRRQLAAIAMRKAEGGVSALRQKIQASKASVVCSVFQEPFARHMGFIVAGTFSGPDSIGPDKLSVIIKEAEKAGAIAILNNKTGGHGVTADIINRRLKIRKLDLINFPEKRGSGGFFSVYEYNIALVRAAVEEK